jgi:para-nitrobenzyl esterase
MSTGLRWLVAIVASAAVFAGACEREGLEQIEVESGPVLGVQEEVEGQGIWIFRGIPYAAPPVGDLRWAPPQPAEPWSAPRDCSEFGPACPQPAMVEMFSLSAGPTEEDCLYLNVWTPAESGEEGLPVMVWIHGGSFETGAGSMGIYDGRHLASRGVVVVTINYRLGPLGFLSHPALSATSATGTSGNYGLLDQIAALEWVQTNISGFGGDPGNVTVFGQSAGGISILDLIVSPAAEELFQRAIAQSGIIMDQGFGVQMAATKEQAEAAGKAFAEALGVDPSADVAAQMRAASPDELLAAAEEMASGLDSLDRILVWKPVVDGVVLPDLPSTLWLSGGYQEVSLLVGTTADEAKLFLPSLVMSETRYEAEVHRIFGDFGEEALELYPGEGPGGATQSLSRMLTEVGFASTARFAASVMSSGSTTGSDGIADEPRWDTGLPGVYLYEFTRVPFHNPLGAFHAVEIPYVFGTLDLFDRLGLVQPVDRELSTRVMTYWTRFAATGDPNGESGVLWPEYREATDLHLELGDAITVGTDLYDKACDFADRVRGFQ